METNETFGIGNDSNDHTANNEAVFHAEPRNNNKIADQGVVKRAVAMLRLHNFLKTNSDNGTELNSQDLFFHNEIMRYLVRASGENEALENGGELSKTGVDCATVRFGMQVVPMRKDGNCLFNAIAYSVSQFLTSSEEKTSTAAQHYVELGIEPCYSNEEIALLLRKILVNELKENKTKYFPFLQAMVDKQYDQLVESFGMPGVFSGDMGDLMVKALANVLKTPFILLTNMTNYQVITITPDDFIDK
jgi:hypothetical protein